jgi:hypothetical protein
MHLRSIGQRINAGHRTPCDIGWTAELTGGRGPTLAMNARRLWLFDTYLEVKASATVAASNFAALKALQDQLGNQFRAGVVLYLGDQIVPFGDQLWLVPLPALWEH